jgi:predicted ATPase/class 3 adenylate cyclase
MSQQSLPSGTVTFLFTDIEGSTQLLQRLGDDYPAALTDHRRILRSVFEQYDGHEIDTQGDSFFVAFKQAAQAVSAVAQGQHDLASHPWPRGEELRVRMALHTGEPKIGPEGYVGLDVHRAARICACGYGGQVLLSEATRTLVEQSLPDGLSLRDLGEHRLKDLQRPEHIYQLVIAGLPSDFPPLKSLDQSPNNLPLQLTSFIGREREIVGIKRLIQQERLVTLVGAGGSGKTRLAIQASAEILDQFPHGAWFVDLAPLSDPSFLAQSVAAVLSLHEEAGIPILAVLSNYLSSRSLLLILDNCEHMIEACARLAGSLLQASPGLKIMATSREPLGIAGESLLPVPTLSLPIEHLDSIRLNRRLSVIRNSEAVNLFVERAEHTNPAFRMTEANAIIIAQICRRLDGIPLAIELAAARTRVLHVEQILARLDDRFHLLTAGSRTALPRQQTLHALVDWSYDLLSETERRLFSRLSIFSGGWTLEAAEAICSDPGIDRSDILDTLASLVDKSLVISETTVESTRFRMLETIRQYALEQLQVAGELDELRQRHLGYYFQFVQECEQGLVGPDPGPWLKLLDTEKDNCYAALAWSVTETANRGDETLQIAGGLWTWWLARGALSEGGQWLNRALSGETQRTSPRAKALVSAAILTWQQGDYAEANHYLDESLSILRDLDPPDLPGLAHATHVQGHLALDQTDYPAACKAFQKSLDFYTDIGDHYYVGTLTSDLGLVAYHQGDYASAREYQESSLEIFQEHGNQEVIAQTMHRLGELARLEGDYSRAKECYEACLRTYQELGMKLDIASNKHKLGYIAQHEGDFQAARALFNESLSIQHEAGNKQGIAESLAGLAGLAAVTGEPARSLCLFSSAQALLDAAGVHLAPADLVEWARDQALARDLLEDEDRARAECDGQEMSMDQAVEYALRSGE